MTPRKRLHTFPVASTLPVRKRLRALYDRREALDTLIRSLEKYQRSHRTYVLRRSVA
jgi:hypothetical protein